MTTTTILLYAPNIVGYVRLALLVCGLSISMKHPFFAAICFIGNLVLDAVDGFLARFLHQTSTFGAILDYTMDRISLTSYAILLAIMYPNYMLWFILSANLDLASHLFHLKARAGKASHKEISSNEPLILRLYYKRFILLLSCLTHDLFFIFLFLTLAA